MYDMMMRSTITNVASGVIASMMGSIQVLKADLQYKINYLWILLCFDNSCGYSKLKSTFLFFFSQLKAVVDLHL